MVEQHKLRFCAFCYKECNSKQLSTCSGCRKRKYCSRECQRKDWSDSPSAKGQRHKLFCKLHCGEEDHDWEIRYIDDTKGYGMFALRDFSRGERILVERIIHQRDILKTTSLSPTEKLAIEDLMPKGGSMLEKVQTNSLSTDEGGGIGIRLVRVNHACVPNACHYDEYKGVKLLVARTAIEAGEEITIAYHYWYNLLTEGSAEQLREKLVRRGIVCLPNCKCRDSEVVSKVHAARALYKELNSQAPYVCGSTPVPREKLDKLMDMVEEMELSHSNVWAACDAAHAEYVARGDKESALRVARKTHEMHIAVYGPKSESVVRSQYLLNVVDCMC
jgi:hypothetical protein